MSNCWMLPLVVLGVCLVAFVLLVLTSPRRDDFD